MAQSVPAVLQNKISTETVWAKVAIIGNSTQASIKTYCENLSGGLVYVYHEDDALTHTAVDADVGFGTLDNDAAPAVIAMLLTVGNAAEVIEVSVPTSSIVNVSLTGAMTAGVPTLCGTSATGVTPSKNIAFTLSCTSLDIDEDASTTVNCSFWVKVTYRKTQPAY